MPTSTPVSLSITAHVHEQRVLLEYAITVGSEDVLIDHRGLTSRLPPSRVVVVGPGQAFLLVGSLDEEPPTRLAERTSFGGTFRLPRPWAETGHMVASATGDLVWVRVSVRELIVAVAYRIAENAPHQEYYATTRVSLAHEVGVDCRRDLGPENRVASVNAAIRAILGESAAVHRQAAIASAPPVEDASRSLPKARPALDEAPTHFRRAVSADATQSRWSEAPTIARPTVSLEDAPTEWRPAVEPPSQSAAEAVNHAPTRSMRATPVDDAPTITPPATPKHPSEAPTVLRQAVQVEDGRGDAGTMDSDEPSPGASRD